MNKNHLIRVLGGLALVGGITAVPIMIAFARTGWGTPGSSAYQAYEQLNRLMVGALLFMSAGWLGLILWLPKGYGRWAAIVASISSFLMVLGVATEFWLFTNLPYSRPDIDLNLRHIAFILFSLSSLLLDISATVLGVALWRLQLWPRWGTFVLLLALPLDVTAFLWLDSLFLAATILALVVGVNLVWTKPIFVEMETAVS